MQNKTFVSQRVLVIPLLESKFTNLAKSTINKELTPNLLRNVSNLISFKLLRLIVGAISLTNIAQNWNKTEESRKPTER